MCLKCLIGAASLFGIEIVNRAIVGAGTVVPRHVEAGKIMKGLFAR